MAIKITTQDNQDLYISTQLISTLRVVPLHTHPLTYGIECVILPSKSIFIKVDDEGSFETRQAAEQALQTFVETVLTSTPQE